jgi:integral membrane sensor domain MASE1
MKSSTLDRLSWPTRSLLLGAAYFVTGKLGLLLAVPPGYATAVWPPSGIALSGLLVLGARCWPGVWLGSFCANLGLSFDGSSFSAIVTSLVIAGSIALGAAFQALLGATLIRKRVGWPPALIAVGDVCRFMVIAGPLSCLTNATWSTTLLWLAGVVPGASFLVNWATWWIGDTIGSSLFSVLCLVAAGEPRGVWRRRWLTVALPLIGVFAAVVAVFFHSGRIEARERRADFTGRAILQAELLQQDAEQKELLLGTVAGRFESAQRANQISRSQFQSFTGGCYWTAALEFERWDGFPVCRERNGWRWSRPASTVVWEHSRSPNWTHPERWSPPANGRSTFRFIMSSPSPPIRRRSESTWPPNQPAAGRSIRPGIPDSQPRLSR